MKLRWPLIPILTLLFASIPVAQSGAGTEPASDSATRALDQGNVVCSWQWKKKRVTRWVRRHGKLVRVSRIRKVKVRVCVEQPPPPPARLGVKAWEFGFTLSRKELDAGDTIIELNNQGEDDHNLHIQRIEGGDELSTPDTVPGQTSLLRFTTTPGTYRLWCSLPTHSERGMETTLEVG